MLAAEDLQRYRLLGAPGCILGHMNRSVLYSRGLEEQASPILVSQSVAPQSECF